MRRTVADFRCVRNRFGELRILSRTEFARMTGPENEALFLKSEKKNYFY